MTNQLTISLGSQLINPLCCFSLEELKCVL